MTFFMEYPILSRGSRGETDTPGPGESVFAIRFVGFFEYLRKKQEKLPKKNYKNPINFLYFLVFA